jgi:ribonucleoside-diphosphate reductase alpha chain
VPSLLAALGEVIERHMIEIGFMPSREVPGLMLESARKVVNLPAANTQSASDPERHSLLPRCPKCSQPSLIRQEGCDLCTSCGYSKCS